MKLLAIALIVGFQSLTYAQGNVFEAKGTVEYPGGSKDVAEQEMIANAQQVCAGSVAVQVSPTSFRTLPRSFPIALEASANFTCR